MGDSLGPYELRGELGRGAMAVVWRAWDTSLRREVALKEAHIPHGTAPVTATELSDRFIREGRAVAGLSHPNIVTVFAADVYDGRPVIAMELIEGDTLSSLLAKGRLPISAVLAILNQLLDAVGYAHSKGVVHRDIKPENVFVTPDGRVKLTDFGIAHIGSGTALTQAGTVMGTPGYMAPEQVVGSAVDGRADIFSVGVVAYEMLTGSNPFIADGAHPTTVMYRVLNEDLPDVRQVLVDAPEGLAATIAVATAKDASQRFSTAEEMNAALRGDVAVAMPRVTTGRRPTEHGQTKRNMVVGAVALTVIVLAGLWVFASPPRGGSGSTGGGSVGTTSGVTAAAVQSANTAPKTESFAIVAFRGTDLWATDETGENEVKLTGPSASELQNFSSEGYLVRPIYLASGEIMFMGGSEGYQALFKVQPGGATSRIWNNESPGLIPAEAEVEGPFVRPDGTAALLSGVGSVFGVAADGRIGGQLLDLEAIYPRRESATDGKNVSFSSLDWSPDGKKLAFVAAEEDTPWGWIAESDGRNPVPLGSGTSDAGPPLRQISWSPSGAELLAVANDGKSMLLFGDDAQQRRLLYELPSGGEIRSARWSPDGSRIAFCIDETLWVMRADGSERPQQLGSGYQPEWVPASVLEKGSGGGQ